MPSPMPPPEAGGAPQPEESEAPPASAAELMVERAVDVAERSIARRLGEHGLNAVLLGLRVAGMLAVAAYFVFCGSVLVARYYLLPRIDDWRPDIEAAAGAALHAPVSVSRIEADWQGLNPRLSLWDVVLQDQQGRTALVLPQVEVVLSWTTLLAWQPRLHSLTVFAPELGVRLQRDHRFAVAGFIIDPQASSADNGLLAWVLAQHRISVRDARVHFVDELAAPATGTAAGAGGADQEGQTFEFTDVNLLLTRGLTGHHFSLQLHPPAELCGPLDVRGDFTRPWTETVPRISDWRGRLFVQVDNADLARLDTLTHLVPAPARLDAAHGALRAWIDFDSLQVTRLRADVALEDVGARLRPDLQPLRLKRVQGRITQALTREGSGDINELTLTGLQLDGDNLHMPPTDLLFRVQRSHIGSAQESEQSRFEASRLALSDWSRLAAKVPLPAAWLDLIARTAATGTLEDLRATWDGPAAPPRNYALRTHFSGVGFTLGSSEPAAAGTPGAAQPKPGADAPESAAAPGYAFENLAGDVELDQGSGAVRLESHKARVRIPPAFGDSFLAFDDLNTRVRWSRTPSQLDVDLDLLSATNSEIDINGAGSFHSAAGAPAHIEASGRVSRAQVKAVPHYLPRTLTAPARAWLTGALLDGNISNGTFLLRGDPARFPFADPKTGEFHAALRVQDGAIDIAPRAAPEGGVPAPDARAPLWPTLRSIDANITFDRNQIVINGRRAMVFGYELTDVTARLPQYERADLHLLLDGSGDGPLGDLLHFVAASPVSAMTGGALAAAEASGPSRLRLKLDVPLAHAADSLVDGAVAFRGDDVTMRPEMAPLSGIEGELQFNQRGVRFSGITAGFLGGDARIDGDTRTDGSIAIHAIGTATPQGAKRQVDPAFLRRLLDHTHGAFHYNAVLTVQHKDVGLQVDSGLEGLEIDLPEPFRKSAVDAMPLHVGIEPVMGASPARDTVRVTLDKILAAEIERGAGAGGAMGVERGAIGIGASASLPERGLLLRIDEPTVDVDQWQTLLAPPPAGAGAAGGEAAAGENPLDRLIVNAGSLTIDGKALTHVALSAARSPEERWDADIDSDQATGAVQWAAARADAPARLTARLAKLAIPEQEKQQVTHLLESPQAELPTLDIVADDFDLGGRKLGRLEVQAQAAARRGAANHAEAWNLQKLALTNPDGKLNGTGAWTPDGASGRRRMNVNFTLTFSNAGNMLGRFGIPDTIRNGTGRLEGQVSWRGSPFAIDYPSLAGKLRLSTEKGQLLKADAGAGRLLGVLSLESLGHRLTGDFRDVFSAGVAFDSITASASIVDGRLTTDDFIMKGVSAVMRVKGTTDVGAGTYNLEVVVVPQLNADATLAYALVNPAIGLGVFLGQYILRRPIMSALTDVYEVTGPWSDPQVKRVKAETLGPAAANAPSASARAVDPAPSNRP